MTRERHDVQDKTIINKALSIRHDGLSGGVLERSDVASPKEGDDVDVYRVVGNVATHADTSSEALRGQISLREDEDG
jgi:hypothetical protein